MTTIHELLTIYGLFDISLEKIGFSKSDFSFIIFLVKTSRARMGELGSEIPRSRSASIYKMPKFSRIVQH
jgi:hypothetical protein